MDKVRVLEICAGNVGKVAPSRRTVCQQGLLLQEVVQERLIVVIQHRLWNGGARMGGRLALETR